MNPILERLGLKIERIAAAATLPSPEKKPSHFERPPVATVAVRRKPTEAKRELPTPDEIRQIRERAAAGERQTAIAFDLGMSRAQVSRIVRGNSYRVDPGPVTRAQASRAHHKLRRLSADDARQIRSLAAVGMGVCDLSDRYRVDRSTISRILRGDSYADCPGPILYTAPRVRMGGAR